MPRGWLPPAFVQDIGDDADQNDDSDNFHRDWIPDRCVPHAVHPPIRGEARFLPKEADRRSLGLAAGGGVPSTAWSGYRQGQRLRQQPGSPPTIAAGAPNLFESSHSAGSVSVARPGAPMAYLRSITDTTQHFCLAMAQTAAWDQADPDEYGFALQIDEPPRRSGRAARDRGPRRGHRTGTRCLPRRGRPAWAQRRCRPASDRFRRMRGAVRPRCRREPAPRPGAAG